MMTKNGHLAPLILKAAAFAAEKHRHQRRKDLGSSPYINHPIALASILANEVDVADPDVLCAALLHDTIEDTQTTATELRAAFGERIAGIVLEVTDDKALDKDTRKRLQIEHARHLSPEAKLVKLADKICNLKDILSAPPMNWQRERKQAYFDWAAKVVAGLRGSHDKLEAIFDELYSRRTEL